MKVSLKWLKQYVDINLPPQELAHKLTMSGSEVSGINTIGGSWDKVFVAQLVDIAPHPNADRLRLATVDLGGECATVVCGAPNLTIGDKVAFAKLGARLFDGHGSQFVELKPAKIRGVVSEGMVASEKELGISEDHTGILILPPDAPVGAPLAAYLGDTVLDLDITPNRPDCLSMIGIAREVAALTGQKVRLPELVYAEEGDPVEQQASVEILDADLCPRYCASLITGVAIRPSPLWMQERLTAAGMRPINNIVDVTNYVMMEYGQPLHSFDYDQLADRKIIVRRAREGECLTTLDGQKCPITTDTLVIADGMSPVALAGVMGGAASEVTEETKNILLESANFNRTSIRRTAAELRMRTEASLRFEKGLSPELPQPALRRATQLMLELGGGKVAWGIIDIYPGRKAAEPIVLTSRRLSGVLGVAFSAEETAKILRSLGFDCQVTDPDAWAMFVTVPYWRTDIRLPDDLAEEVARMVGYDSIPNTTLGGRVPELQSMPMLEFKERVRDLLACCGMREVNAYSLTSLTLLGKVECPSPTPLRVANPMTVEQEYLRTTLRAGILATFAANERHEDAGIRIFEVGRVYLPRDNDLPEEREMLVGVLGGRREEAAWFARPNSMDFFDAKGVVEAILSELGVRGAFVPAEDVILNPGRTASIQIGSLPIGVLGEVHSKVLRSFDIACPQLYLFEIDLASLMPLVAPKRQYRAVSKFPPVVQDIALVVDEAAPAGRVQEIIEAASTVSRATLFDVYTGAQVPAGKKSLAYSIVYQSPSRTLTDAEVARAQDSLLARLRHEAGATLRS
ncbi:MAG: phenylalanine--tRNA ligase subunit beta [Chloroflexi bacterium]|nr:phenylalanine--tRNA ligase subunit beta [Chloroflexota bacterium]